MIPFVNKIRKDSCQVGFHLEILFLLIMTTSAAKLPESLVRRVHPKLLPRYQMVKELMNARKHKSIMYETHYGVYPEKVKVDEKEGKLLPPSPLQGPTATFVIPTANIQYKASQYEHLNRPSQMKEITISAQDYTRGTPRLGVLARKVGVMGWYDEWGVRHPVTVIKVEDCQVYRTYRNTDDKLYTEVVAVPKSPYMMSFGLVRNFLTYGLFPRRYLRCYKVNENGILPIGKSLWFI
jgi:hypothetical protein